MTFSPLGCLDLGLPAAEGDVCLGYQKASLALFVTHGNTNMFVELKFKHCLWHGRKDMWRNYNALVSLGGVVEAPGFIEQFHNLLL